MQPKPDQIYKQVLHIDWNGQTNGLALAVPAHSPHNVYSVAFIEPNALQDLWETVPANIAVTKDGLRPTSPVDLYRLQLDFESSHTCPVIIPTIHLEKKNARALPNETGISKSPIDIIVFDTLTLVGLLGSGADHIPVLIASDKIPILQAIAGDAIDRIVPADKLIETYDPDLTPSLLSQGLTNHHPVAEIAKLVDNYVRAGEYKIEDLERREHEVEKLNPAKMLSDKNGKSKLSHDEYARMQRQYEYARAVFNSDRQSANIYSSAPASQAAIDQLVAAGAHEVVIENPYSHDWASQELADQAKLYAEQLVNPTGSPENLASRLELTNQRLEARAKSKFLDVQGSEHLAEYATLLRKAVDADPEAAALAAVWLKPETTSSQSSENTLDGFLARDTKTIQRGQIKPQA